MYLQRPTDIWRCGSLPLTFWVSNCNLKWKLHHFCISSIDQKGSFLFLSIFLITDLDPRNDLTWLFIKIKWVLLLHSFKVPFSWWQVFLSPFLNPKIQSSSLVCFICHVTAGQIANMRKTQKLLTDWIIKCYLFVPSIKRNLYIIGSKGPTFIALK